METKYTNYDLVYKKNQQYAAGLFLSKSYIP